MILSNGIPGSEELTFSGAVTSLFLVLNAVGQIPLFISMLSPYPAGRQKKIIIRELIFALIILILFTFFGNEILQLLGVSRSVIRIAGGILLLLISLTMIFPSDKVTNGIPKHEPIVVPLAIPVIAGPGSIAYVMLLAHQIQNDYLVTAIVFLAWLPSLLILLAASYIKKFLGEKGLMAMERLGGMIVCLIGVQMLVTGIIYTVKEHFF